MKKILAIAIISAMVLTLCSCGKATTTADSLTLANDRAELAQKLGCDVNELDNFILYAKNMNKILTDENEETATEFKRGTTEEGLPYASKEEVRTMVTPVVITTTNWKNYFTAITEEIPSYSYDEDGNEIVTKEDSYKIGTIPGYYYDWTCYSLTMKDNETGEEFEFSDSWQGEITFKDGKYYCTTWDDEGNTTEKEFNVNDYTCIKADMIVYKCDIDESLLCGEKTVGDEMEKFVITEENKDEAESIFICINTGTEEEPYMWELGMSAIGDCVYGN